MKIRSISPAHRSRKIGPILVVDGVDSLRTSSCNILHKGYRDVHAHKFIITTIAGPFCLMFVRMAMESFRISHEHTKPNR